MESPVTTFVKVPFEDLVVNVPRNSKQYLRKMYGDDCLTRYVIQTHTDNHSLFANDVLPHPKIRMKLLNTLINLENKPTVASTITCLCLALITNEFATSDKDKNKRHLDIITRHMGERYLGVKSPFGV